MIQLYCMYFQIHYDQLAVFMLIVLNNSGFVNKKLPYSIWFIYLLFIYYYYCLIKKMNLKNFRLFFYVFLTINILLPLSIKGSSIPSFVNFGHQQVLMGKKYFIIRTTLCFLNWPHYFFCSIYSNSSCKKLSI